MPPMPRPLNNLLDESIPSESAPTGPTVAPQLPNLIDGEVSVQAPPAPGEVLLTSPSLPTLAPNLIDQAQAPPDSSSSPFPEGMATRAARGLRTLETGGVTPSPAQAAEILSPIDERYGLLGRLIDYSARPEYASAAVVDYLIQRRAAQAPPDPFNGITTTPASDILPTREELSHVIDLAWGGLTGETKFSYDDLVRKHFPDLSGPKRMAFSFALAVALDPTNVVFPLYARGVRAASQGIRAATSALASTKTAQTLAATRLGRTARLVREAFVPGAGVPKDIYESTLHAQTNLQFEFDEILKTAQELRSGMTTRDLDYLRYLREHPDAAASIAPDSRIGKKLSLLSTKLDGMIDSAHSGGLINDDQLLAWEARRGTYFPSISESSRNRRMLSGDLPPAFWNQRPSFMRPRRAFDTTQDRLQFAAELDNLSRYADDPMRARAYADSVDIDFDRLFPSASQMTPEQFRTQAQAAANFYRPVTNAAEAYALTAMERAAYEARQTLLQDILASPSITKVPWNKIPSEGNAIFFPKGRLRFFSMQAFRAQSLDEAINPLVKMVRGTHVDEARFTKAFAERMERFGFDAEEAKELLGNWRKFDASAADELKKTIKARFQDKFESFLEGQDDFIPASTVAKQFPSITRRVPAYEVPIDVARFLKRGRRLFAGDDVSNAFLRFVDRGTNAWKLFATSVRLPFHLRNFYSNVYQAWQAGVNNPNAFKRAAGLQEHFLRKSWDKTLTFADGRSFTIRELHEAAGRNGIRGRGWIGSDAQRNVLSELSSILRFGNLRHGDKARYLNVTRLGRAVGTAVEDNARLAVFIDQLDKGADFKSAASQVRKFLFDYTELTPFERSTMRRLVPFYTWSRKNSVNQIENLIFRTNKFQLYGKSLRAVREPETAEEHVFHPRYFDDLVYVKTSDKTPQGKTIYRGLDLPPLEFNRLTDGKQLFAGLHPLKDLVASLAGYRFFPEWEKTTAKGGPVEMVPAPAWLQWLPPATYTKWRDSNILAPITNTRGQLNARGEAPREILGINRRYLDAFHSSFPLLNEIGRTYAYPISLTDERPDLWRKSYLTGMGHKTLDKQYAVQNWLDDYNEGIQHFRYYLAQRGQLPDAATLTRLFPDSRHAEMFLKSDTYKKALDEQSRKRLTTQPPR